MSIFITFHKKLECKLTKNAPGENNVEEIQCSTGARCIAGQKESIAEIA
jgi:hypothetical protein